MPKPIKKRKRKKEITEEEVFSVLETFKNYYENNKRFVHLAVTVVIVLILIVSFGIFYLRDRTDRAYTLSYQGYKYFHKLYDASTLSGEEALNRAIEKFQEAYKKRHEPRSLYYIALIHLKQGKTEEALKNFETLVQKFPRDEEYLSLALYNIAQIQLKKGERDSALKTYERLFNLPNNYFKDLALYESARLLEEMNKKEEAKKKYTLIVEKYPSSPYYSMAKSRLEEEKKGQ